nr:MAG TPA: hypothetical protein [Caudoviricetes sp.]
MSSFVVWLLILWGLQKYNYFLNNQNHTWQNSIIKNNTLLLSK